MTDEQKEFAKYLDDAVRFFGLKGFDEIIRIFCSHLETDYTLTQAVEEYYAAKNGQTSS